MRTGSITCCPVCGRRSHSRSMATTMTRYAGLLPSSRPNSSLSPVLVDLQTEKQVRIPQLQVRVDYEKAKRYGLTPSAITEALETLSNGRVVSQIIDQSKRFDVVLRLSDEDRSTYALGEMLIESPAGRVPLKAVADVFETDGPNQIQRENGRRRIAVLANTDGSDMAKIIEPSGRSSSARRPQGYFTQPRGPVPGAGRGVPAHCSAVGCLAAVDLRRAV